MRSEQEAWVKRLPADEDELLAWCLEQSQETLLSLLAFLAASSVDALHTKFDSETSPRLAQAATLATSLSLDMAKWWQPSVEGFHQRLPKATMLHIGSHADFRNIVRH